MSGDFLYRFFEERGIVDVKPNGEADVLCPFLHDKGYESRPSAHINVNKWVFHCKTCSAEGRFSEGGLSEIGFVAAYYTNGSYSQAVRFMSQYEKENLVEELDWENAHLNLFSQPDLLDYLEKRGITEDVVKEYKLGWTGGGIVYPVFVNGVLLDTRTYNPTPEPGQPKIVSRAGSSSLLFPFDAWSQSEGFTLLCAGENDTLLARKMGFNAITNTFGEGSFPQIFLGLFKGRDVFICYDCDEAGKKGAHKVAFLLYEAGACVRIVDLGLSGTKDDKDITDYFIKHNHTAEDLYSLIQSSSIYSGEMYQEDKNVHYPLVDLWNAGNPEYAGKHISSRVLMAGRVDTPLGPDYVIPSAVEFGCGGMIEDNPVCMACHFKNKTCWWLLDENPKDLLHLVDEDEKHRDAALLKFSDLPTKCPRPKKTVREYTNVQHIIFNPDVDTEDELSGFRMTDQHAYVINNKLDDGQRYRIYYRTYAHPKNSAVVAVVDRVEESDNSINMFQLTPEVIKMLSQFQGDPFDVMEKRHKMAQQVVGPFAPRMVVEAVNIMYHSVLDFTYAGKPIKGHPEGLIIGPSRTGKTDTAKKLLQFYGLGNFTECKTATTAGLLGGADKAGNGGHRIKWGKIPRNHKGMLFLDEYSGMPQGVMATLTALRSERIARLEKIVSGAAPAKTRLFWMSNPRVQSDGKSRNIALYPTGVSIVLDLIGSDEDIARFDFVTILPNIETYISPFSKEELEKLDNTAYRNLIYWAWSRKANQVKFAPGVEEYIWQVAQELNEHYDTDIKFLGAEAHKKLSRIAVSVAAMCFSHNGNGECVVISKCHVDYSKDFLVRCYDNGTFRLPEYVRQKKMTMTTNEEINLVFAGLAKSQSLLMKTLSNCTEINLNQLQMITGIERTQFSDIVSNLVRHGLVEATSNGVMPTLRFRKAREAYEDDKQRMIPLSERGAVM